MTRQLIRDAADLIRAYATSYTILSGLGCFLLVVWGIWWGVSIRKDHLFKGEWTWLQPCPCLGWDFLANFQAVRAWHSDINPYIQDYDDPAGMPYCYAPVLLRIFGWCGFVGRRSAVVVWMVALTVMASLGALASWESRRKLGLWALPLPFVLLAVLGSLPVVYALERGNCDLLVLVLLFGMLWGLRSRSILSDVTIGICLALATWIKIYPGLLVIGLVALGRPRVVLFTGFAWLAIGLTDVPNLKLYWDNLRWYTGQYDATFYHTVHTLTSNWKYFWTHPRLNWLAKIPGVLATAGLLLPLILWVSYRIYRCENRQALLYPYLLWMMTLATFFPPVSNDYNLFFLPLTALAIWDRRDPVRVHLLMAPLLFWWQPFQLGMSPALLMVVKLGSLVALAISLCERIREQSAIRESKPLTRQTELTGLSAA